MDWLREKRFGLAILVAVIILHAFSVFWVEAFSVKLEPAAFTVQPGTAPEAGFAQWLAQKPLGAPWLFVRNWGYHFVRYFPVPVVILCYAAALALLVPAVHAGLVRALERAAQWAREAGSRHGWKVGLAAVVVFLLVTWLLRQKWALLGDNAEAASTLPDSQMGPAWCLTFAYYKVILTLGRAFSSSWNGMHALRLGNCLAGVMYLAAAAVIARLLGRSLFQRAVVLLALLTLGNIQLFFAYVGTSGLFFALLAVCLAVAIAVAQERASFPWAAVVCVLATAANPGGLMLLPSLLYLAWLRYPAVKQALHQTKVIVVGGLAGITTVIVVYVNMMDTDLLPWFTNSRDGIYWAAFGCAHMVEMLNHNLIVAPFGLAAVVLGGLWIWRARYPVWQDRSSVVLLLTFAFLEAHSIIRVDGVGYADWDQLGHQGLPLALLTVYLMFIVFGNGPASSAAAGTDYKESAAPVDVAYDGLPAMGRWGRELCVIVIALTGFNTLLFILVNATDMALARAKEVTLTDKAPAYSPYLNTAPIKLGIIFQKNAQLCPQPEGKARMFDEAANQFELGMRLFPQNQALGLNLALSRASQGRLPEARALLLGDLQRSPVNTAKWRVLLAMVDLRLIAADGSALVQDSMAFQNFISQRGHEPSDSEFSPDGRPLTVRQALGPAGSATVGVALWQIAERQAANQPAGQTIKQLAVSYLQLARQLGGDQLRIDNLTVGELLVRMQASLATNAVSAQPAATPPKPAATNTNAVRSTIRPSPAQ